MPTTNLPRRHAKSKAKAKKRWQTCPATRRQKPRNEAQGAPFFRPKALGKKPLAPPRATKGSNDRSQNPQQRRQQCPKDTQQTFRRRPKTLAPWQRPAVIEAEISEKDPQKALPQAGKSPQAQKGPAANRFPDPSRTPPAHPPPEAAVSAAQQRTTEQGFANVAALTTSWAPHRKSLVDTDSNHGFAPSHPTLSDPSPYPFGNTT